MSWRRNSRLCLSLTRARLSDTSALHQMIKEERDSIESDCRKLTSKLSSLNENGIKRLHRLHQAAQLVNAIGDHKKLLIDIENNCNHIALFEPERRDMLVKRREYMRNLVGDWRKLLLSQQSSAECRLSEEIDRNFERLQAEAHRLQTELIPTNNLTCCSINDLPLGVLHAWHNWLELADKQVIDEVIDSCTIIDCQYIERLSNIWGRYDNSSHIMPLEDAMELFAKTSSQHDDIAFSCNTLKALFFESSMNQMELLTSLMQLYWPSMSHGDLIEMCNGENRRYMVLSAHRAAINDWCESKKSFGEAIKTQVTLYIDKYTKYRHAKKEHAEQQVRCIQLRAAVNEWKRHILEREKARQIALQSNLTRQKTIQERISERTAKLRELQRSCVEKYRELKEEKKKQEAAILESRELYDKQIQKKVMANGIKRVKYRAELINKRKLEQDKKRQEMDLKKTETCRRLDILRNQVRVIAPSDPARVLAETESFKHRIKENCDQHIAEPSAVNHSFWDNQILSDRRSRLELQLRESGLMHLPYARQALVNLSKPQPPHLQHTAFYNSSFVES